MKPLAEDVLREFIYEIENYRINEDDGYLAIDLNLVDTSYLVDLYIRACETLDIIPKIPKESNMLTGELSVCCHVIDYYFELENDLKFDDNTINEIEYETKRVAERNICKGINNSGLTFPIDLGGEVKSINGGWEIRR